MPSKYDRPVDPNAPNNPHALELELVGWNRRVLELGAASGHMTRALVAQRCRVTAIERDAEAARDLEGVAEEIIVGDLDDPSVLGDLHPEFDTVLAGDVLEHLLHPADTLASAAKLLAPGGQVVVSVPNVGHVDVRLSLVHGNWDYQGSGLLDDSHIRFFTYKSIYAMVKEAGLIITDLRRVRIPVFESELAVDREGVPVDVLDLVLADPEAETYQFVFSAAVASGDRELGKLADQNHELELQVTRLKVRNGALESAHELDRVTIASLQSELVATNQRVWRIEGSFSWQLLMRIRGRVIALLGGEDSAAVNAIEATLGLLRRSLRGAAD